MSTTRLGLTGTPWRPYGAWVAAVTVVETETTSLRSTGRLVDTTQTNFTTGRGATTYDVEEKTVSIDADGRQVDLTRVSLTSI